MEYQIQSLLYSSLVAQTYIQQGRCCQGVLCHIIDFWQIGLSDHLLVIMGKPCVYQQI